jgi:hypothetical protein
MQEARSLLLFEIIRRRLHSQRYCFRQDIDLSRYISARNVPFMGVANNGVIELRPSEISPWNETKITGCGENSASRNEKSLKVRPSDFAGQK